MLARPPPPTHYKSVAVTPANPQVPLPDVPTAAILTQGVHLPPPRNPTHHFFKTKQSPLMTEVVNDLIKNGILEHNPNISHAFRPFLVLKPSGAARPVYDLSPWTALYHPPPIRLYSAAGILTTIPPGAQMIKIDLRSGFFQIRIRPEHRQYYGVYYKGQRLQRTRLPMGHPLAPSIMQRVSTTVARHLHVMCDVSMVAYLDDWLFFSSQPIPVPSILHQIRRTVGNHHQQGKISATANNNNGVPKTQY